MNLIFDIDGTLWNTTAVVAKAWNRAVFDRHVPELKDLNITDKMLQREFGKPMDVIADNLFGDIEKSTKDEILEICCVYEHDAIDECDEDLTYPKMKETIRTLAKTNRLFIVSNCQNGYVELVMKKNGITDIIDDFECFGHTGLQKDDNIRLIIERNGLNPEETVYIGDTIGDYTATKKAGLKFVFASYGFGSVDNPDYVISSFEELLDFSL